MNPYEKLLNRKRKWTPVQTTAGTCKEGAEKAIHRALALRHMELPVGDFISDALASEVPSLAREVLVSNVKDEQNHDIALGYIANAYGVDEQAEAEAYGLSPRGRHILITRSPKHWWPSVRSSSFFYHSFALMVTLA